MKKNFKKLGVLVFVLACFIFVGNVKAFDNVIYPDYGNGTVISFSNDYTTPMSQWRTCLAYGKDMMGGDTCKKYVISEDNGVSDPNITLTNQDDLSDTFTIQKGMLTPIIKYSFNSKNEEPLDFLKGDVDNLDNIKDLNTVQYYKYDEKVGDILKTSEKNDIVEITFLFSSYFNKGDENIEVPEGVSVVGEIIDFGDIVNNGDIFAGRISGSTISGTGNLIFDYEFSTGYGDGAGEPLEFEEGDRFSFSELSGVKINIVGTEIKEGLTFYSITDGKDLAPSHIDMINNCLSSSFDGYKFELQEYNGKNTITDDNYTVSYGKLVKKDISTTTAKANAESTPKTSDNLISIVVLLSGAIFTLVYGIKSSKKKYN